MPTQFASALTQPVGMMRRITQWIWEKDTGVVCGKNGEVIWYKISGFTGSKDCEAKRLESLLYKSKKGIILKHG